MVQVKSVTNAAWICTQSLFERVLLIGAGFLLREQQHIGTHQPTVTVSSIPELEEITSLDKKE